MPDARVPDVPRCQLPDVRVPDVLPHQRAAPRAEIIGQLLLTCLTSFGDGVSSEFVVGHRDARSLSCRH